MNQLGFTPCTRRPAPLTSSQVTVSRSCLGKRVNSTRPVAVPFKESHGRCIHRLFTHRNRPRTSHRPATLDLGLRGVTSADAGGALINSQKDRDLDQIVKRDRRLVTAWWDWERWRIRGGGKAGPAGGSFLGDVTALFIDIILHLEFIFYSTLYIYPDSKNHCFSCLFQTLSNHCFTIGILDCRTRS